MPAAANENSPRPPGSGGDSPSPVGGRGTPPIAPRTGRPPRPWIPILATVVVVIVAFSALWGTGILNFGGGTSPPYPPVSYATAAPLAPAPATTAPGGPWTIVAGEGLAVPTQLPPTNLSSIGGLSCTFAPVSKGQSNVSIPVTPAGTRPGEAAVWVFFAKNSSLNTVLVITVGGGRSVALGYLTGCGTVTDFTQLDAITGVGVVDSTSVAAEFNANGGTPFLDSETVSFQLFLLLGGFSGTHYAPLWEVKYSTCAVESPSGPGTWISAYYYATNGTTVTPPTEDSGTCT